LLDQGNAHAELGDVRNELLGAVERVDHPRPRASEAVGRVGGLLGEPAVVRKARGDQVADVGVGFEIRGRDGGVGALLVRLDLALVVAPDDGTGLARGAHRDVALARVGGAHGLGLKPPSGPKMCALWYSRTRLSSSSSRRSYRRFSFRGAWLARAYAV